MLKKDEPTKEVSQLSSGIIIGGIIGGIIGIIIAFLYKDGRLTGFRDVFGIGTIDPIITGTVLGIVAGAIIGALITLYFFQDKAHLYASDDSNVVISKIAVDDTNDKANIKLREEQLDISKKKIQTSQVKIHKEVSTEKKHITVPVNREELVIEKITSDSKSGNKNKTHTDTIRIPLSEEHIDISKHPEVLEDVSIYNHKFEEVKQVKESLKKEVAHINTKGNVKVVNEDDADNDSAGE